GGGCGGGGCGGGADGGAASAGCGGGSGAGGGPAAVASALHAGELPGLAVGHDLHGYEAARAVGGTHLGRHSAGQLGLGVGRTEVQLRAREVGAAVVVTRAVPSDFQGIAALRAEARLSDVFLLEDPCDVIVHALRIVPLAGVWCAFDYLWKIGRLVLGAWCNTAEILPSEPQIREHSGVRPEISAELNGVPARPRHSSPGSHPGP
ncbi:hypothetical protein E3T29_10710, partial [Cryobacterium sp. TMT1-66-1]